MTSEEVISGYFSLIFLSHSEYYNCHVGMIILVLTIPPAQRIEDMEGMGTMIPCDHPKSKRGEEDSRFARHERITDNSSGGGVKDT